MISKWFNKKEKAVVLRLRGNSIKHVEKTLNIPRSTLSGWFKNIELTLKQKKKLHENWKKGLIFARKKAVLWHHEKKKKRLEHTKNEAIYVYDKLDINDKSVLELALAMLYLGEGVKTSAGTILGNSDPQVLKFFVSAMEKLYGFNRNRVKCSLHLRADQNEKKLKKFWSSELKIPLKNFLKTSFDKRTKGNPTYKHYFGVCVLSFGTIAIQRKLVYLSKHYCEKIISNSRAVSSVGRASR